MYSRTCRQLDDGSGGGVYTCTYRQLHDGLGSSCILVAASSLGWIVVWTEAPFEVTEDIVQLKQQGLPVCEALVLLASTAVAWICHVCSSSTLPDLHVWTFGIWLCQPFPGLVRHGMVWS